MIKVSRLILTMTFNITLVYLALKVSLGLLSTAFSLGLSPALGSLLGSISLLACSITVLMFTFPPSKGGVNTLDDWGVMAKNRLNFYSIGFCLVIALKFAVVFFQNPV